MASPALAGLILDFFYTGPSALAGLFPEVFAQEVPKPVVCLAATAVSTCNGRILSYQRVYLVSALILSPTLSMAVA